MSKRDEVPCAAAKQVNEEHRHECRAADQAVCARLRFHVCHLCRRYFM